MTLQAPVALSLLALTGGIVFLYFLRAHNRSYDVSALFLWEGLANNPQTRAARIRKRIDLLLILQIAILALASLALAQPQWLTTAARVPGLVIVIDASASMRTITPSGASRYEVARARADDLLDRYPTSPAAIIQYCEHPRVLSQLTVDHDRLRRLLTTEHVTWYADGDEETLAALIGSVVGSSDQAKVIVLSDHSVDVPIPMVDEELIDGGQNVAITSFSVREDEDTQGVAAFVRLRNFTDRYVDTTLRVSDKIQEVSLPVLLAPGQEQAYVLPFSGSLGPEFSASIMPDDDFDGDNRRYFALPRSIERRVRWIGERNRYLEAAIRASGPITILDENTAGPADLTVVYNVAAPGDVSGNILLVHASISDAISLGEDEEPGALQVTLPDDPLLAGVDPSDFRVALIPEVTADPAGKTIIRSGESPLLYCLKEENRSIVLIAPDIMHTNLPLTIDFPVLVRNILALLTPRPTPPSPLWANVGEPLSLQGYGSPTSLTAPDGKTISTDVAHTFIPQSPDIYTLTTDQGTFPLAVNVPLAESIPAASEQAESLAGRALNAEVTMVPLWPQVALAALVLFILEAALYHGWRLAGRKK